MHTAEQSWALAWNEDLQTAGAVDADLLQEHLFQRIFGISDARNDPRLKYAPGTLDSAGLKAEYAGQPGQALFELHSVTPEQLMHTADRGGFYHRKARGLNRNYGVDCLSMRSNDKRNLHFRSTARAESRITGTCSTCRRE